MDRNELKSKIARALTVALPILLVAILAMLIVVAMNMSKENSVPVLGGGVGSTTTTTTTSGDGGGVTDDPAPDPSSKGLSFLSHGDGTCSLLGLGECDDGFIIIPCASPDGDIVVEIADNAFKNCSSIRGVEICDTIERVGAYAFYGSTIREIVIPKNVEEIGNYAFSGCKYLEKIEVDVDNRNYSSLSGVLYNKPQSTLITYPAGKTENFVNISVDVTKIANMAFYRASYVKKVNYHGTKASWGMVEIGAGNDVIDEAILYCAGDNGK